VQTYKLSIDPAPDFRRLDMVLRREGEPDRVPLYELVSNLEPEILRALGVVEGAGYERIAGRNTWEMDREQHIRYMLSLGYDYILLRPKNFAFPQASRAVGMTTEGERGYFRGDTHMISDRADFEKYLWPDPANADYDELQEPDLLPSGMKAIVGYTGILENVMWLLGYEGVSYLLHDDLQLVRDMFEAIGSRIVQYMGTCASYDSVGALQMGEDMGFKTQTFLSPEIYREFVFPWHRRLVEAVHEHNKPIILHSCGNLSEVMDDIIDCGWDAKHSFEDAITPVWEAKERWGDRIAILGGFDVDKLCRMGVPEIREYTRFLIKKCAPGGGWALGTGNSIASYIPIGNLFAMHEEGFASGQYG